MVQPHSGFELIGGENISMPGAETVDGIDISALDADTIKKSDLDERSFVNLLLNGDFENGNPPNNWTASVSTLSRETTPTPKVGTYIMKVLSTGAYGLGRQAVPNYARYAGRKVTLGGWCYAPSANAAAVQHLSIHDGVGQSTSDAVPRDDAWHWVTITREVDDTPTHLWIDARANHSVDGGNTDILYVDGLISVEGDTCPAFSPKPASIPAICDIEVFSGNSPNPSAWTDLDLSAVVGANPALVFLRLFDGGAGGGGRILTRPNGETEFSSSTATFHHMGSAIFGVSTFAIVACLTDSAGIIEWYDTAANQAGVTIDVIGFIK